MQSTTLQLPALALRENILVFLFEISKPIYRKLFKAKQKAWRTQCKDLAQFEEGSLGKDLYYFLSKNNFEIEPKLESHDVGHVLLGYETDVKNEICMQFFYLGSGKKSVYSLLTTVLGYLFLPEVYKDYHKAFRYGKTAINFQDWDFEFLLKEPTKTLQAQIFSKNIDSELFI